jgi:hypothetical protein
MAIRNDLLGGSDWEEKNLLTSQDLNDTFNAAVNKVQTLTAFWLNPELYDVYDDFESYSVGAFTTNAKWTVSGTASIASEDFGEGTTKVCRLNPSITTSGPTTTNISITSLGLLDNRHTFAKIKIFSFRNGTNNSQHQTILKFKLGEQTTKTIFIASAGGVLNSDSTSIVEVYFNILVLAKGSNKYDVYANSKLIYSGVTEADPNIFIEATASTNNSNTSTVYLTTSIDDVRQSKGTVN